MAQFLQYKAGDGRVASSRLTGVAVYVLMRCCFTFPFTYTCLYAAKPDNSNTKSTIIESTESP